MTQLNLLAVQKDFYFNTIVIQVRTVELVVLTCIFRVEHVY